MQGERLVGKTYTAQLEIKRGDELEIKLGKKQIRLGRACKADPALKSAVRGAP